MYGAIIGDIVGSRFEFDNGNKSREFEFFTPECEFTDDTVMTVAVAEALMDAGKDADEATVKANLIKSMKKWGQKYPHAGYGARFISWVLSDDPEPYGSYGNGSAMRVSSVGWLYDTIERTREVARWTAEVTHNHPEGVKGAESIAAAIFLARHDSSKEDIRNYIVKEFGYDLTRTLDEIRPNYYHVEDCMRTVPEALECFLEADSYESTLRNVMFIGGDTDTLGAIAGAVAEAFWGVTFGMILEADRKLKEDIRMLVKRFEEYTRGESAVEGADYKENLFIKFAVEQALETRNVDELMQLIAQLIVRIRDEGEAPTPMEDLNNVMGQVDFLSMIAGDRFVLDKGLRLRISKLTDENGKDWIPLFTDVDELEKQRTSNIVMNMPIRSIVEDGYYAKTVEGVVINPFGQSLRLDKRVLEIIVKNIGGEENEK